MDGIKETLSMGSNVESGGGVNFLDCGLPKGHVCITLLDVDGNVIDKYENHNVIVNNGRQAMLQLFSGDSTGSPAVTVSHMGLGVNGVPSGSAFAPYTPVQSDQFATTSASKGNSAYFVEVNVGNTGNATYTRQSVNKSYDTSGSYSVTYSSTFPSTGTGSVNDIVSEAALFNTSSKATTGDKMIARFCFPSMYLKNDVTSTLQIQWTISF